MKRTLLILIMAFATLLYAGCEKEPAPAGNTTPEEPTTLDILHTSWQGVYNGTVQHPQAGAVPCVLTWTIDFVDESKASIMLEMVTGGQPQQPQEMTCSYTYDGRHGTLISMEEGETQSDPFEVDPINRSFTIDLRITTGFSQENPQVVGGPTTFRQIH